MRVLFILLLSGGFFNCLAQTNDVDTVSIVSKAMHNNLKCVVIKPAGYDKNSGRYPVIYLLHGYSGNYSNWIKKMPSLPALATTYNSLIVCPDGGFSSWYIDSPVDSSIKYETFITKELLPFIDERYRTVRDQKHRAITGLSMGGHGALMLAMRHQDLFGAAASMSGAVDLHEIVSKYDTQKKMGDTIAYANYWKKYSVYAIADTFSNKNMPLLIDCGTGDAFIKMNRSLHEKMQALNITHDYTERNGEHNWKYWTNALPYHLLFFRRFFDENTAGL